MERSTYGTSFCSSLPISSSISSAALLRRSRCSGHDRRGIDGVVVVHSRVLVLVDGIGRETWLVGLRRLWVGSVSGSVKSVDVWWLDRHVLDVCRWHGSERWGLHRWWRDIRGLRVTGSDLRSVVRRGYGPWAEHKRRVLVYGDLAAMLIRGSDVSSCSRSGGPAV